MKTSLKKKLIDLGLIYAALVWGSTFYLVKECIQTIHPVTLVAYRFLLASACMAIYLIYARKNLFKNFKAGLALGLLLWLIYIPQTIGLEYTSAANSGFITGLFIVFVPIINFIFFKLKPTKRDHVAITISLCGLFLLTADFSELNYGNLLTLLCAIAYAGHILTADYFLQGDIDPLELSFQQFFVVGFLSLVTGLLFNVPLTIGSMGTLKNIIFLTLCPTLSAFIIQLIAQKNYVAPLKVALIFTLEPVFAALFAWTIGGETFILASALGGGLIVLAMIVNSLGQKDS